MQRGLILLATAAALLIVSCRAEVNIALDVEEDGSGTVAFEFGTDEEFREFMTSFGADPDDLFGELESGLGSAEGTAIERQDGDMSFKGVEVEFDDVDQISSALGGAAGDFGGFDTFTFEVTDTGAVFDATLSPPEQDPGDDLGGFDPSLLTDDVFSANFILEMPGNVTSHNADTVLPDDRLQWALPLLGGTVDFHAESDFGGSGLPWLWVILGIALLVGLIAVVVAVVLGRRHQRQAVDDAAAAYPQEIPVAPGEDAPADAAPEESTDDEG